MMNCEQCRDILSGLIEGELPPIVEAEARAHLGRCPECARELAELRALVAVLHELLEVEPPPELRARLRDIPDQAAPSGGWQRARFIVTSVAAAAAALLIVWTGLTHYQGRPNLDLTTAPPIAPSIAPPAEDPASAKPPAVGGGQAPEAPSRPAHAVVTPAPPADEAAPARPTPMRRAERPAGVAQSRGEAMEVAPAPDVEPPPASRVEAEDLPLPAGRTTPSPELTTMNAPRVRRSPVALAPAADGVVDGARPGSLPVPEPLYLDARGSELATATDTGEGSPFVISVMPPRLRVVDEIVAATITLETEKPVERAQLSVSGSPQLELVDVKPDGKLFDGPLRAGQQTVLSLHMQARAPGAHSLTMRLRSTDPVVDTRLAVGMGEFVEAVPPAERPVQFSFTDTPIREAAGELSRQSGLRIQVAPECAGRAVTVSAPDPVPAGLAVRSVAAAAGCAVAEQDEVLVIEPAEE